MQIESSIIEACLRNDRRGQRKLYELCYSYLMSICYRYAPQKEEALELLNTGFLKVLNGLEKKPNDIPFKFWIRRIMINSIIDEFRKSKSYKENTSLYDYTEEYTHPSMGNVANEAEQKLSAEDIYALIRQLPQASQKVFNLYVIDGYSHKEIGELLHISEGTSKWHLSTAKAMLKDMIIKTDVKLKVV